MPCRIYKICQSGHSISLKGKQICMPGDISIDRDWDPREPDFKCKYQTFSNPDKLTKSEEKFDKAQCGLNI